MNKLIEEKRTERKQHNERIKFLEAIMLSIRLKGSRETWHRSDALLYSEMDNEIATLEEKVGDLKIEIHELSKKQPT